MNEPGLAERIVFHTEERKKSELKIKLHRDGLTQTKFFNAVLAAYTSGDPLFMEWFANARTILISNKAKDYALRKEEENSLRQLQNFGITEADRESIFDLIAEEME